MIVAGAAEVAASIRILAFVIVNARTSLLCDALTLSFEDQELFGENLLHFIFKTAKLLLVQNARRFSSVGRAKD